MLYVPYIVLNELDKIKTFKDNLAKLARTAIGFINENLNIKNDYFCLQSASEQMKIIQIDCGDDLILNACLHINNITRKVLLISNDINLRNKAHANQISCMSGMELIRAKNNSSNEIRFQ